MRMKNPIHQTLGAIALSVMFTGSVMASGTVTTATQSALHTALLGGGLVKIAVNGTITFTSTETISANTVIDATGYSIIFNGNNSVRPLKISSGVTFSATNVTFAYGK